MVIWFGFNVKTNAFLLPTFYRSNINFRWRFFWARIKKIISWWFRTASISNLPTCFIFSTLDVHHVCVCAFALVPPIPETMLNTGYWLYLLWALCIRGLFWCALCLEPKSKSENMCHFLHRSIGERDFSQHGKCSNKSNYFWPSQSILFFLCGATFIRMGCAYMYCHTVSL